MNSLMRAGLTGLLTWVAACGSVDTNKLADAPAGTDGKPGDGTAIDAAPTHGSVTVHVLDPKNTGADAVGVPVVFIDSAGTQTVPTNGSGVATADVHTGASATSIAATATGFQLQTITEIAPGDAVTIGSVPVVSTPPTTFTLDVPLLTNATSYNAFGPCGVSPTVPAPGPTAGPPPTSVPVTLTETPNCAASPTTIVVHAFDAAGNLGFIVQDGLTLNPGGTTTITGAYSIGTTMVGTYGNLSAAGVTTVQMSRFAPNGFGFLDNAAAVAPTAGAASLSTFGPTLTSNVVAQSVISTASGTQTIRELVPGGQATYTFDGPSRLLPFLGTPSADLASGVLTVPVDPTGTTGTAPDLFRTVVAYNRSTTSPAGVTTTTQFQWFVYGPTPGNVTLPTIPATVGAVMPLATDALVTLAAESIELDTVAGYAQARLDPIGTAAQINLADNPGATLVRFALVTLRVGVD